MTPKPNRDHDPFIQVSEHSPEPPSAKKVLVYGFDAATLAKYIIQVNADGEVSVILPSSSIANISTGIDVATATTLILPANADRNVAEIVNNSDTVVYLRLGAGATLNSGIRLNAGGGAFNISAINLYTGVIEAIHGGSGDKLLTVTEY